MPFPVYDIKDFIAPHQQPSIHFHINTLEAHPPLPPGIQTPHKHRFYELFFVQEGTAHHLVDYEEYEMRAGSFFFISPGQLHFWSKTRREGIRGFRLMFTEEFFLLFEQDNLFLTELVHFDNVYQHPLFQFEPGFNSLLFTYFDLLHREYQRENCYEKALYSLLFLLLAEVRRLCEKQPLTDATKHRALLFRQFLSLLEIHFQSHWTADEYAKSLHISPRHLNRILNEMTNQSLSDIIRNRLILESKRLLTFSGLAVAQIAEQLGFEDAAYFARYFRKAVGMSPTDFRESLSEKYHK